MSEYTPRSGENTANDDEPTRNAGAAPTEDAKPAKKRRGISRRAWLIGSGVTVAGLGVAAFAGSREPEPAFIFANYGSSGPRVLVAYDSQYGSTGGVADAIGQRLGSSAQVEVRMLPEVADLDTYDAIVFGAPVQRGVMKESATSWLAERSVDIAVPMAMFMPSASFGIDPDKVKQTELKMGLLEDAAALTNTEPVAMQPFGGVVDFSRMSFISSTIYQITAGNSTQGDFRDFDAIRSWTDEITPQLIG